MKNKKMTNEKLIKLGKYALMQITEYKNGESSSGCMIRLNEYLNLLKYGTLEQIKTRDEFIKKGILK